MFMTKKVMVATKNAVIRDIMALFKIYFGIVSSQGDVQQTFVFSWLK
jgi:hypothetical protein